MVQLRPTWTVLLTAAVLAAMLPVTPATVGAQEQEAREYLFSDVTSGVHKPAIDVLGEMGLFDGTLCGEGMFCPSDEIKRSTMAVWLIRALEDDDPAPPGISRFADIDSGQWWARYVERLAELEITVGCEREPLRYCPDRSVDRGEMASLLVRAFDLDSAEPAGFADIEGNAHAAAINALAAAGITAGCQKNPLSYCPGTAVNRAEMATFLARALGLVEAPTTGSPSSSKFLAVSAGGSHSCGLRVDSAITCWPNDAEGSPYTIEGQYTAVSAGLGRGCGIRSDQSVWCWDQDGEGLHMPFEGRFTAVSQPCGLRVDQIIVCSNSHSHDRFTAVSVGAGLTTCRVRADDRSVECPGLRGFSRVQGPFTAVSVGGSHACGLRADQTITCGGDDEWGQSSAPEGRFTAVSTGAMHSCGLRADQTVTCWGDGRFGQSDTPEGRFTAVSTKYLASCGLRTDQTVTCWGPAVPTQSPAYAGRYLSVSGNRFTGCGLQADQAITCFGGHEFGQRFTLAGRFLGVSANDYGDACGLRADQTITCWGDNESGQLSAPEGRFTAVSAARSHACGLRADQTITCWGDTSSGDPLTPPAGRFLAVSAAGLHACGLRADQTITCWGDTSSGDPLTPPAGRFLALFDSDPWAGDPVFCGLRADRMITCWGDSFDGPISIPRGPFFETFVQDLSSCARRADQTVTCWNRSIEDATDSDAVDSNVQTASYSAVSAGGGFVCGLHNDETIACWGDNTHGQTNAPAGHFRMLAAGNNHSCGVRTDFTVVCWGDNTHGQTNAPAGHFRTVSSGANHSCGILFNNMVACWGDNTHGQTNAPEAEFVTVSSGANHSCGILFNNMVACWGDNTHGQTNTPPGEFHVVSAGNNHSCGVRNDSTVACWGDNTHGQTNAPADAGSWGCALRENKTIACWGDNTHGQANAPTGHFRTVLSGANHSCALRENKTIACWGDNTHGQTNAPAGTFQMVSTGNNHSCALRENRTIACWGDNTHGQTNAPAGTFLAVTGIGDRSCGVREDRAADCWGTGSSASSESGETTFNVVSAGNNHSCGVTSDLATICWGDNTHGQADAPAGAFTTVSARHDNSCGLREDQMITCWGAAAVPDLATLFASALPETLPDCRRPSGAGEPARPADVRISVGAESDHGMATEDVRVYWSRPCGGGRIDDYVVQWRPGNRDFSTSRQRTIEPAANTESYSFEVPDLEAYAVRVIAVNDDGRNSSATHMVPTVSNELRRQTEQLVMNYQDRYPWLSDVWDHMRDPSEFKLISNPRRSYKLVLDATATERIASGAWPCDGIASCAWHNGVAVLWNDWHWITTPERWLEGSILASGVELETIIHEAAHVHTLSNRHVDADFRGDAPNPAAIGAGLLYLSTLGASTIGYCDPKFSLSQYAEFYADLPEYLFWADGLAVGEPRGAYWISCTPGGHDRPPEEAIEVARSVFAEQELPQWFSDTYQRDDGSWNVGAIRAQLAKMRSHDDRSADVALRLLRHLIPQL